MNQTQQNTNKKSSNSIVVAIDYFKELFRKWYVYLFFIVVFCGLTFWYIANKATTYEARLTFMTNQSSGGKVSNLLRMANSFGLNVGGGSSSGGMNAEILAELLASNRMLKTTLLNEHTINGKKDLFINHYQKLVKNSSGRVEAKAFNDVFDTDVFAENEMHFISEAIKELKKDKIRVTVSDNGVVVTKCVTNNEAFTQGFTVKLVENLRDFYSQKSVQTQQENNDMLASRVDSLNNLLKEKEATLRAWLNKYTLRMGAFSLTPDEYLTKAKMEREAEITSNLYKESVQAFELAKLELESSKPIIQIIDYPELPLKELYPIPIIFYAVAIIGALMIATVLILFFKLIKDALRYENSENL